MILWQFLLLTVGLVLVVKGGDMFVDSSIVIARHLHVPRILIGGTIVSIATTMPELVVSATASVMGDSGIAVGNAVGSAIANIGLIVGMIAILVPVVVDPGDFRIRASWMVGAMVLVILFAWSLQISRLLGILLLSVAIVYLVFDYVRITHSRKKKPAEALNQEDMSNQRAVLTFLGGAVLVIIGSRMLVISGIEIATAFGIPSVIIGLSVIAIGTSLPELVTAVASARKGVPDLSIGNIIGANVLNLAMIVGCSATIRPLSLSPFTRAYSFPWLVLFVMLMTFWIGKEGKMTRSRGILFLGLYGLYLAGLIAAPFLGVRN